MKGLPLHHPEITEDLCHPQQVEVDPTLLLSPSWDRQEEIEVIMPGLAAAVGTVVAHQEEDLHRIGTRDQGAVEDLPTRIGVAHLVVPQVPLNTKEEDMEAHHPSINKVDGTRDHHVLLVLPEVVIMEVEEATLVALTEDLLTGVLQAASIMVVAVLEVVVCQGVLDQSPLLLGEFRLQASMVVQEVHQAEVEGAGEEGHQVGDLMEVF